MNEINPIGFLQQMVEPKMHPIAQSFKIRCHAISQIMPNARGDSNLVKYNKALAKREDKINEYEALKNKETKKAKNILNQIRKAEREIRELEPIKDLPHLSVTTKTYLKKWLKAELYSRKKEFANEYTEKGNKTEEDGITLIAINLKTGNIKKNEKRFEDECKNGVPDILVKKELVIDNKSSYSLDTFPMFDDELKEKGYEWQIQGYMGLTGAKKGKVCYTLNNMPNDMIQLQIDKFIYNSNKYRGDDPTPNEMYDFIKERVFTKDVFISWQGYYIDATKDDFVEIPKEKRIKTFDFTRDDDMIKAIDNRVIECRKYLDYLLKQ